MSASFRDRLQNIRDHETVAFTWRTCSKNARSFISVGKVVAPTGSQLRRSHCKIGRIRLWTSVQLFLVSKGLSLSQVYQAIKGLCWEINRIFSKNASPVYYVCKIVYISICMRNSNSLPYIECCVQALRMAHAYRPHRWRTHWRSSWVFHACQSFHQPIPRSLCLEVLVVVKYSRWRTRGQRSRDVEFVGNCCKIKILNINLIK